ncbi:putative secreted protein (Por secretion system target) [Flavobacterium endophyticum]|uniref:Putative secreted protein (Por secretion system target) n=1 Tax=Flavobacterium endophyticum TaxID=1540163 RepID=A0A495MJA6_9FLAO|nr:GEVED domain-containing protein [Flavobacterium endophyticum]RKS26054.1 putative secreted protein (Por secretion system target) [Flavobacterium endophyticum]
MENITFSHRARSRMKWWMALLSFIGMSPWLHANPNPNTGRGSLAYCTPAATSTSSFIKDFSTTGGSTNISNLNTGQGTGGYANHTTMTVGQYEGAPVSFSAVYNTGTFGLAIWVDWNNNETFETSERMFQTSAYSSSQTGTITVPAGTAQGSYRMRVLADFNSTNPNNPCAFSSGRGEAEDYTFVVTAPPACLPPTNLAVGNMTPTTARLTWTSTRTLFDVEYGPAGFTQGTGTMTTGTANPLNISGLTAQTAYQFYVRTDCGPDGKSAWAGPFRFFTGYCTPAATSTSYFINSFTTTGGFANINNTGTTIGTGGYSNYTAQKVSHFEGGTINFSAAYSSGSGFAVWVDWNNNMTFETGERMFATTAYGASSTGNFTVPAGTPVGNYRMRIRMDYNNNSPSNPCTFNSGNGEAEDYTVEVVTPPSCLPPTELGVGNLTFTGAQLSWLGEGTVFDVEYGPAGFTQGTGTMASSVANPYDATGLTPNTSYQFYVRRICSATNKSPWAGPFRFFTGYCTPAATSTSYFINSFTTTGGFANINNTGTTIGTGGYSNYTAQKVSHHENGSVSFSAAYSSGSGFSIWIDWNRNMAFDTDERVFTTTAYGSSSTGNFNVPAGTPVGNYRMRIRMDYNNSSPSDACTFNSGNGEAEDYTFEVVTPPTCMPPTELGAGNVTFTTAQFSWLGEGTVFDVEYGPAGFTQGTGTMASSVANPYDATGLTADTSYQFYVRRVCSATDKSPWAGPFRFYTGPCRFAATSTSYFIRDFTTTGGFLNISNTATGIGTGGYSNFAAMRVQQAVGGTINFSAAYVGNSGFAIWVDWNKNMVFDTDERVFNTTAYGVAATGSFAVPAGTALGSYRMRIMLDYNSTSPTTPCAPSSGNGEAEDYTVEVVTPPSCLPPTNLAVGNMTPTAAQLTWTSTGTLFDVEYGPAGFTPGTGTMTTGTANPLNISGLTAETAYQFYVRRDCGTDGKSAWAGPFRFFTGYCTPAATSTSYFISSFTTTGGSANISNTGTTIGTGGYSNFTAMKVQQYEGASVGFSAAYSSGSGFAIWVDWNNNMVFDTNERVFSTTAYGAAATGSITVPATTPVGNYRMRIRMDYNNTSPSDACGFNSGNGEAEDYTFEVVTPPACPAPTGGAAGNLTFTTAQLTWVSSGTSFDVEYGPAGFTQGTGTMATAVANPYDVTGLTSDTAYQFYVRRACSTTDKSTWAGPFRFYTGYCLPAATGTSNYIKDFSTTGGYTNISNLNTGQGAGGYANHTSMAVSQHEGAPVNFSAVYNGGTFGLAIWVDWNRNMVFETSERMFQTTAYSSSQIGTITVPSGTPVGSYRMRVLADFNLTTPNNPCGFNTGNGEVEDYTFQVATPPSCLPPAALAASATSTTAQLSWTSNGTSFDVEYGPRGFTQGTGTMATALTQPQHGISGLTSNTAYQFYVRRNCGAGDLSAWAGPFSFTTACGAQTVPYLLDFNEVTIPALPVCTSIQNAGTGNNWKTDNVNGWGFASKLLNYSYNSSNPANAWFYTNGIQLEAGTNYTLKFQYGNSGNTNYVERLKVNIAASADYNAMTRNIVDYPAITNNTPLESSTTFTVETSGVYYLGFNAYSITDRAQIYVDNIAVDVALSNPDFETTAFKAYPNPVKDLLHLSYSQEITEIAVFNMVGQQVLATSIRDSKGQIDLSALPSGTYVVKARTADSSMKTIKVIKQ